MNWDDVAIVVGEAREGSYCSARRQVERRKKEPDKEAALLSPPAGILSFFHCQVTLGHSEMQSPSPC